MILVKIPGKVGWENWSDQADKTLQGVVSALERGAARSLTPDQGSYVVIEVEVKQIVSVGSEVFLRNADVKSSLP